jgi:hypothetical protein
LAWVRLIKQSSGALDGKSAPYTWIGANRYGIPVFTCFNIDPNSGGESCNEVLSFTEVVVVAIVSMVAVGVEISKNGKE